jgi:hypothetical protein
MIGPLRRLARDAARILCTAAPLLALGACAPESERSDAPAEHAAVVAVATNLDVRVPSTAAAAVELRSGEHAVAFSLRGARAVACRAGVTSGSAAAAQASRTG